MIKRVIFISSALLILSGCAKEKPRSTKEDLQRMLYDMGQDYAREHGQNTGMDFDQYQKERQKVLEGK